MIDTKTKNSLRELLEQTISEQVDTNEVPVLLSGGYDSTLVGFCLHELGHKVVGVSYELDGIENTDCVIAENTCFVMGWRFEKVIVSTDDSKRDFLRLIETHRCKKKTELEILFVMIEMLDRVKNLGFSKVFTGFESWLPDRRDHRILLNKDISDFWRFAASESELSSGTQKCIEYSNSIGVEMVLPLEVKDSSGLRMLPQLYSGLSDSDCHKPVWKYLLKCLYENNFKKCDLWTSGCSMNLQTGGNVEGYFSPLLDDTEINHKGYKTGSKKNRLSHLIQLWGKKSSRTDINFKPYNLSDVYRESSKELFTVVSTFAGGGGSSTGYRLSGGKILFVNEFIPTAIETYQTNYPDTPVSPEDIRDITSGKARGIKDWFKSYGVEIGELDILDGSPPCSAFSVSKRLGKGKEIIQSKVQKYSETTQISVGMLIHEYVSLATVSQPKVIVIENVPSIKSSDVFHSAMNRLKKSGYLVNFNVLTSCHFGVSQKRKRLFVVGIREDIGKTVGITNEKDILQLYPSGSNYEPTIRDCLKDLDIDERERNFLLTKCRKSSDYEILRRLPVNPDRPLKPENVITGWKGNFNLIRSSWDKPCGTLTQLGQQIGQGGVHHPSENRMFTIAELKRLTSLPDDFVLTGTFNQKAERICRMVPPLMIKHLSTSIYENVLSKL